MNDDELAAAQDRAATAFDRLQDLVRAAANDEPLEISDEDALAALAFARAIGKIRWKLRNNRRPATPSVEYLDAFIEVMEKPGKGRRP